MLMVVGVALLDVVLRKSFSGSQHVHELSFAFPLGQKKMAGSITIHERERQSLHRLFLSGLELAS